jgi:hypothetical protein
MKIKPPGIFSQKLGEGKCTDAFQVSNRHCLALEVFNDAVDKDSWSKAQRDVVVLQQRILNDL